MFVFLGRLFTSLLSNAPNIIKQISIGGILLGIITLIGLTYREYTSVLDKYKKLLEENVRLKSNIEALKQDLKAKEQYIELLQKEYDKLVVETEEEIKEKEKVISQLQQNIKSCDSEIHYVREKLNECIQEKVKIKIDPFKTTSFFKLFEVNNSQVLKNVCEKIK